MADNEEPKFIVGSSGPECPDSAKFPCVGCKADVWLARSGQRMVRDRQAVPLCMTCLAESLETDHDSTVEFPSKEKILEDLGIVNRN